MGLSFGGSSGSSRTSSSSSSSSFGQGENFDYGVNVGQTYLDQYQQQGQNRLQDRFFAQGQMANLGRTTGLEANRQNTMQGLQRQGNIAQNYGQRLMNQGNRGQQMLGGYARQNNPYLQRQINGLAQDYGQMFNEQILPGIGSNAQNAGQRGGSRQGIAEALGAQRVAQEFGQQAGQMRMNAYGQQQQAATDLMNAGMQGAASMYGLSNQSNMMQGQLANEFAGTQLQASAQPFTIGSSVIGAPSVLSQQYGMDMGYGYNLAQSRSQSQSKGKSKNSSVNFGM
jgi:hypothetical protein